jgi:hypothetical protein
VYNLTTSQLERVRNLVRRSPVFIGKRIKVHDDAVEVLEPEDLVLGFGPVFEAVAGAPAEHWPNLVDDRLRRMFELMTGGSPELDGPTEQILNRVYARLRPAEGSPTEWWNYARELAPGVLVVLALDHPDHISLFNDEQVERHGFDRLLEAGLENLYGQLPEKFYESDGVYVLNGSDYVGDMVMVLPGVVHAVTGETALPHGMLVAMPTHQTLVFHILRDGRGARYALGEMARIAAEYYEDSPHDISDKVYWWPAGADTLQPVAHQARQGHGVIGEYLLTQFPPAFAQLLEELDRVRP